MPYIILDSAIAQAAPSVAFGQPEAAALHPMGKSLDFMRTRLRVELGNRSSTDLTDGVLTEWINDAYADLVASLDLPESKVNFTIETAANQPLYSLPTTLDTIRSVSGSNDLTDINTLGAKLNPIDVSAYRKLPSRVDVPQAWFRENTLLVTWPTPDATYALSIDARLKPWPLALGTDYPILEDKWHEALYKGAKYRAWEGLQNDTKSLLVMNEMTRLVQRKKDRDAEDKDDEYPSLRPVHHRRDIMSLRHRRHRFGDDD